MIEVKIKPMSANESYKGRKFKTDKYKFYTRVLLACLPDIDLPDPPYFLKIEVGLSSMAGDADNPVKPFQDIIQQRYGFNDNKIGLVASRRIKTKKKEEFIRFELIHISEELIKKWKELK